MKIGITMLIHNKDDIEFVTEFPCFLGTPCTYRCPLFHLLYSIISVTFNYPSPRGGLSPHNPPSFVYGSVVCSPEKKKKFAIMKANNLLVLKIVFFKIFFSRLFTFLRRIQKCQRIFHRLFTKQLFTECKKIFLG